MPLGSTLPASSRMFLFHHVRFLFQARLGRFEIASAMAPAPVATLQVRGSLRSAFHTNCVPFHYMHFHLKPLHSILESVANSARLAYMRTHISSTCESPLTFTFSFTLSHTLSESPSPSPFDRPSTGADEARSVARKAGGATRRVRRQSHADSAADRAQLAAATHAAPVCISVRTCGTGLSDVFVRAHAHGCRSSFRLPCVYSYRLSMHFYSFSTSAWVL